MLLASLEVCVYGFLKSSKQRHLGKRGECGESVNKMGCVMVREIDGIASYRRRVQMVNVRAHVFVSGRVQGVFFRYETKRLAVRFRVCGWARNLFDGRVEAVFEGEKDNVERLVEFCRRGPPGARVENVEVVWEDYKGEFEEFGIRYRG
jgi:acylphosphatase